MSEECRVNSNFVGTDLTDGPKINDYIQKDLGSVLSQGLFVIFAYSSSEMDL